MKAIFCKGLNAHYNNAILNVAINSKLNSADLHLTNGGGGAKSRLCIIHHFLNPNLSLKIQPFQFSFKNALHCHTELTRSIHKENTLLNSIYGYFAAPSMTANAHFHKFHSIFHQKFNLFHTSYPNFHYFRSVFTDKFTTREVSL